MRRSFFIVALAALQCACGTQPVVSGTDSSLISFAEIANEITVRYENMDGGEVQQQPVVMSFTE